MEGGKGNKALRVFLWIVPRTNSTAYNACLMNETVYNPEWGVGNPVIDEMRATYNDIMEKPEYLEMKKQEEEIMEKYKNVSSQEQFRYPWLKERLEEEPNDKQLVVIKDQSFAIYDRLEYLPDVPTRHIFLIKHPKQVYPSLKDMLTNHGDIVQLPWDKTNIIEAAPYIPIKDLYKIHRNHWRNIKNKVDKDAIVIDGHDLTSRPEVILPQLCAKLEIPYRESYLQWASDPELVYSIWRGSSELVFAASKTVATSRAVECSQFAAPKLPRGTSKPEWKITDELKECIDFSMPFYEEMYEHRIM